MHTLSMAFLITKAGSSLLWWGLHSCCTPLWGDSSGPHRFSHTHSRGPAKKEPSLLPQSFKDKQHVLYPELFAPETHLALFFSPLSWRFRTKTKQLDGADQTTVSFKAQNWIPRRQSKGPPLLCFSAIGIFTYDAAMLCEGQRGSKHSFSPDADGQNFGAAPVVGVKLPVPYVSLGPLRFIDQVQLLKKAPSAGLVHSD